MSTDTDEILIAQILMVISFVPAFVYMVMIWWDCWMRPFIRKHFLFRYHRNRMLREIARYSQAITLRHNQRVIR
jgi:hypothetical protein